MIIMSPLTNDLTTLGLCASFHHHYLSQPLATLGLYCGISYTSEGSAEVSEQEEPPIASPQNWSFKERFMVCHHLYFVLFLLCADSAIVLNSHGEGI